MENTALPYTYRRMPYGLQKKFLERFSRLRAHSLGKIPRTILRLRAHSLALSVATPLFCGDQANKLLCRGAFKASGFGKIAFAGLGWRGSRHSERCLHGC